MRILFALPGFHRYNRGAETALISIASELARSGDRVTLIGSGQARGATPYRYLRARSVAREKFESFPSLPVLRNDCAYEELTFAPDFLRIYRPEDFDITLTCSYPFTNWILRRPPIRGSRPPHVFVTENGDWPAVAKASEYRLFSCEGLACTNPDYYDRNKDQWFCKLIPNGVDCDRFRPGSAERNEFHLPRDQFVVLMVSALVPSKRVELGIEAVSRIRDAHLVVAGDGSLRQAIDKRAAQMLPGRFTRLTASPDRMPALYRSANVFLHLSKEESFGNVFLEAMACGLPIVATDRARVRWVVGTSEFLFAADDPAQIAAEIETARCAPTVLQSKRADRAAEFSWTRIAGMYREFLSEVMSRKNQKHCKLR